jgi:hypothetical protein
VTLLTRTKHDSHTVADAAGIEQPALEALVIPLHLGPLRWIKGQALYRRPDHVIDFDPALHAQV